MSLLFPFSESLNKKRICFLNNLAKFTHKTIWVVLKCVGGWFLLKKKTFNFAISLLLFVFGHTMRGM